MAASREKVGGRGHVCPMMMCDVFLFVLVGLAACYFLQYFISSVLEADDVDDF